MEYLQIMVVLLLFDKNKMFVTYATEYNKLKKKC